MHLTRINYIVIARIKTRESSYEKSTVIEENVQSKGNITCSVNFVKMESKIFPKIKIISHYQQRFVPVSSLVIKSYFYNEYESL